MTDPSALTMSALAALVLLGWAATAAQPWWRQRQRARLAARPFPAAWRRILRRCVPLVARLTPELQLLLKRHIQVFIAEKPFIGCRGLVVTDEVRVVIAAQACLLLLGNAAPEPYPKLRQILVYPEAFVAERETPVGDGVVQRQRRPLLGESWSQGQVILSWADALEGAVDPGDGRNVVLHEFAHHIDQDTCIADGRPWRPRAAQRRRWDAAMHAAFLQLRQQPSALIDSYGASDPAEFFAVVSEVFFERPHELQAETPAFFAELADLYGVNPTRW